MSLEILYKNMELFYELGVLYIERKIFGMKYGFISYAKIYKEVQ